MRSTWPKRLFHFFYSPKHQHTRRRPPGNVKGTDAERIYTPFEPMGMVTTARIIQEIGIEKFIQYRVSVC